MLYSQPPSLGLPTSRVLPYKGPYKVLPTWQVEAQGTPRAFSGLAPLPQSVPQDRSPAGPGLASASLSTMPTFPGPRVRWAVEVMVGGHDGIW